MLKLVLMNLTGLMTLALIACGTAAPPHGSPNCRAVHCN